MRTTRLSRLAAPAVGLLLLTASACSGDGGGGTAEDRATQPAPGPTVNPEAGSAPPPKSEPTPPVKPVTTGKPGEGKGGSAASRPTAPTGPVTAARLTAALLGPTDLTATGFRVEGADRVKGAVPDTAVPAVDRAECAVFARVAAFEAGAPEVWAHRDFADPARPGAPRLGITLAAHRDDGGAALPGELDRAMAACAAEFTVTAAAAGGGTPSGPERWSVVPVDGAPLAGDETVAYRVTARGAAGTRVETVVIVRSGATTAQFVYAGDAAPDAAPYPDLISGQMRKARALLGR